MNKIDIALCILVGAFAITTPLIWPLRELTFWHIIPVLELVGIMILAHKKGGDKGE